MRRFAYYLPSAVTYLHASVPDTVGRASDISTFPLCPHAHEYLSATSSVGKLNIQHIRGAVGRGRAAAAFTQSPVQHSVTYLQTALLLPLHYATPLLGLFSRTAWVSRYQKGKTSLDLNEARDDEVLRWHRLDHTQTICTSLQTDNHTNAPIVPLFTKQKN